jgi:meiotically up-regulated gene 157 (Mug157) protein
VSQPSEIACVGLLKTIDFLKNQQIPICGLVENMASCLCPYCGKEFYPFTSKGVDLKQLAKSNNIPYLLSIPQVDSMDKLEPYFLSLAKMVLGAHGKAVDQYVFSKRAKVKRGVVKFSLDIVGKILRKR